MVIQNANHLGASLTLAIYILYSLIFVFRFFPNPKAQYWLGIALLLTSIPLVFLLLSAGQFQRPTIYYVQIGTMLAFLVAEFLLGCLFKIDFRSNPWITIPYVMLFFAGTGGMIGVASYSGKWATITAIILFFIMSLFAFFVHIKIEKTFVEKNTYKRL